MLELDDAGICVGKILGCKVVVGESAGLDVGFLVGASAHILRELFPTVRPSNRLDVLATNQLVGGPSTSYDAKSCTYEAESLCANVKHSMQW